MSMIRFQLASLILVLVIGNAHCFEDFAKAYDLNTERAKAGLDKDKKVILSD